MSTKCENQIKMIEEIPSTLRCSCRGYHLDKLIQPGLLTLLARQRFHGYRLLSELEQRVWMGGEGIDKAGVYRTLKSLEQRGLVSSSWDLPGEGPAKKTYEITDRGRACLALWIETLEEYRDRLREVILRAKEALAEFPGEEAFPEEKDKKRTAGNSGDETDDGPDPGKGEKNEP